MPVFKFNELGLPDLEPQTSDPSKLQAEIHGYIESIGGRLALSSWVIGTAISLRH